LEQRVLSAGDIQSRRKFTDHHIQKCHFTDVETEAGDLDKTATVQLKAELSCLGSLTLSQTLQSTHLLTLSSNRITCV
jgi:hypothetical protein